MTTQQAPTQYDWLDSAERLYGDVKGFSAGEAQHEFGKYFDEYDTSKELFAQEDFANQSAGLRTNVGQRLSKSFGEIANATGQTGLATSGSLMQRKDLYRENSLETYGNQMGSLRSNLSEQIYGFRDDYKQSNIDLLGTLADQFSEFEWGDPSAYGDPRGFSRDSEQGGPGYTGSRERKRR